MKLLVTDYDGTMYYEKQDLKALRENIEALKQFIKQNMVVIATGRPYTSIKKEIDTYSIPYNYIISPNGACIFNQNNSPIYTQTIKEEVIKKTLEYLQKLPYISKIKLIDIYGNETNNLENVIQIYVEIKISSIYELKRIKQELIFKGIDREIVENTVDLLDNDPKNRIILVIKKKYINKISDEKGKKRTIDALMRLGYSYSDIKNALNTLTEFDEEENYD